ncbi:MAG: pyridoxamine 5'-phosphate oxidase family protein [Nocardioidaceae bacterium]|nr:pyridoxamine 5'-phosphate oxidase family protein [Nocardioidaceae bacterium]
MTSPSREPISRNGRGTDSRQHPEGIAAWADIEERLVTGEGTSWLSVRRPHGGVHTRPLFAAWDGEAFVFATKASAVKTSHLEADGEVSLAIDLGTVHLAVEGTARRMRAHGELERASATMLEVYDWPTEVVGEELDAPYAAPTSGGPPFQAWKIHPAKVIALPTEDDFEPTRFIFH